MKQAWIFLVPIAIFITCKTTKTDQNAFGPDEIKAIQFYTKFPGMVKGNEMLYWGDTFTVYRYQDYTIYAEVKQELNYDYEPTITGTVKSNLISTKNRPVYIITRQGLSYGFFSDTSAHKRVSMDSVIKRNSMYDPSYLFGQTVGKNNVFVERQEIENGETVELFIPRNKPDLSFEDTSYLYYSSDPEMMKTSFTFSKARDSVNKKKLYKVRSLYLANPQSDNINLRVNREVEFSFKIVPLKKEDEIRELLKKFIPMLK